MNIHRQLSQIVTTTREYIEEQVQLGFFDMDEETKNTEIPQDIFQNNHLKTEESLYLDLDLDTLKDPQIKNFCTRLLKMIAFPRRGVRLTSLPPFSERRMPHYVCRTRGRK